MQKARLTLFRLLDEHAKKLGQKLLDGQHVTEDLLKIIADIYTSARVERAFWDAHFEAAYHSPITGELEFLVARTLYHYSQLRGFEWKILMRRQVGKTAPDIRIEKGGRTIAVIEIKAKGGWIQPFFSSDRYAYDKQKGRYDPDELIKKIRDPLQKYQAAFNLKARQIFFLLPTFALVHRVRYNKTLKDYYAYFAQTSGLPQQNLILLSSNMRLDLARAGDSGDLEPTDRFEKMISRLPR